MDIINVLGWIFHQLYPSCSVLLCHGLSCVVESKESSPGLARGLHFLNQTWRFHENHWLSHEAGRLSTNTHRCSAHFPFVWCDFFSVTLIKRNQEAKSKAGMLWQRLPNNRKNVPFPASSRCAWLAFGEFLEALDIRYFRYKCSGKSIYFSVQEQWQAKGVFWKSRVHSYIPRI